MSQFGAQAKNPPWVRSTGQGMPPPMGQQNQLQASPMMSGGLVNAQQLNFQQQQAYQQSLSMQQQQQQAGNAMSQQLQADKNKSYVTVTYPFQTASLSSLGNLGASPMAMHSMQNSLAASSPQGSISYPAPRALQQPGGGFTSQPPPLGNVLPPSAVANAAPTSGLTPKQRVFTGTITKLHDNFGFIDGEVFFQTSVCTKGLAPKVGERALVDAAYNANMPFKWNATRVQVLPSEVHRQNIAAQSFGPNTGYNAVPPPQAFNADDGVFGGGDGGRNRGDRRRDQRSRDKERDAERERRREDRLREREKEREKEKRSRSPSRRRSRSPRARAASRSPPRRRPRAIPRYVVQVPKISLDLPEANVLELKRRYTNMYVPSDFFTTRVRWVDAFPANRPITMNRPCSFHVMHKDVEGLTENLSVLEPADADYSFSAKVMLMSLPGLEEVYRKSCALAEDMKEGETRNGYVHPTRLINFLVGVRGKNETMAIGGPWSPSLDGVNPESDSQVLIRTAIRTCKALTGVDLSGCTQWYRFVEIYYRRGESTHKGKAVPARVETVVLFLPDVWSCVPTRLEWDTLQASYKKQLLRKLKDEQDNTAGGSNGAANGAVDDQKDEKSSDVENEKKPEPKHFSELDPKSMKVSDLRQELEARSLSSKGLKSQLVARLSKTLKTEQDAEESGEKSASEAQQQQTQGELQAEKDQAADKMEVETETDDKKKKEDDEKREERERQARERRFALPDMPHILVHPSRTAKSGKFDCTVMSLSLLLDYRQEDAKEHSFEVSLFAELFNEMLMRDFGFRIYRALADAPERAKEEDKERKDKPKGKDKDKDSSSSKKKEADPKKDREKRDEDEEADEDLEEDDEEEVEEESNASSGSKKKDDKSKDKKKEKVKMVTTDPGLLLAFVYFDQTHCGYIFDKDIEEILCTLGLNLSRAQCRKLLQKVVTRDTLNYRKLTDKPRDNVPISDESMDSGEEAKHQQMLAAGNKTLLPVFTDVNSSLSNQANTSASGEMPVVPDGGVVLYRGGVVDISKLLLQLERSEKSRISTEDTVVQLQAHLGKSKEIIKEEAAEISKLKIDLKTYRQRAEQAESELSNADETLGSVRTGLSEFREAVSKLEHIVKVKTMKATVEIKKEDPDKDEEPSKVQEEVKDMKEEEDDSK